jgi:N-acetylmuramoyl-L-alanine amidase
MSEPRKIFHMRFARVSPFFAALGVALVVAISTGAETGAGSGAGPGSGTTTSTSAKRQAASAQFARAEDQRAALNSRPAGKRTLADYKQVVTTYKRVYLITPHAPEVPEALLAVAELYTEMGDQFGRSYYQSAVDSYRFLLHDYPASRHGQDALLRIAQLEKDELDDPAAAVKAYDEFLKRYPHSPHKKEAQEAHAELAVLQNGAPGAVKTAKTDATPAAAAAGPTEEPAQAAHATREEPSSATPAPAATSAAAVTPATPVNPDGVVHVRHISASAEAQSTRVTIELEDAVEYSSARISNPDRIFFDLHSARLTPEAKSKVRVEGNLLTAVRVGQNHTGIVRVVLDVNGVRNYTSELQSNPPALVVDLYAEGAPTRMAKAKGFTPQTGAVARDAASVAAAAPENSMRATTQPVAEKVPALVDPNAADTPAAPATNVKALRSPIATLPSAEPKARPRSVKAGTTAAATGGSTKPDLIQPVTSPAPTRDGQSTLTRALGLKIGRIVIDAGHGGHDTGTIGPTGLMEKDLCLDVALRLGKIIQQRLPGADVVYTRSDDTFIPLEERTRVANEAKADLFISIHANSSHDHAARGIETYYLNLKGSPEAMEVASRENATAQESVHDLEDLVKKIARSEKIDESKEFAEDIQDSLSKRIQKTYKPVKDRGVRKAPFVVLIGADMPSILTEISFLSNPADEQLLKKPEHRQRVAEGLYQGVASYLQSLNSVTVNLPKLPLKPAGQSIASVEQTRNPQ